MYRRPEGSRFVAAWAALQDRLVLAATVVGLAAGGAAWLAGLPGWAGLAWAATTVAALVPLTWTVARDLLRGQTGVDLIALLAMAGALALGEYLAGAVVALMLSGGQVLEGYADSRARRELSALVSRAPRVVHRYEGEGLTAPPLEAVRPGDRLLVKPGEVLPVDGVVEGAAAVLDESALTGEARPVEREAGERVRSGTVNGGGPFDLRATATAAESTYAGIVRLVEAAQAAKAPLVRLADRYALLFLPLTLAVAGGAWALSGDPVRALAVLVVATPCPLILAAPIAIISGVSRAARRGVIVKGGGALEVLARGEVLLLDKTGTVTTGVSTLAEIRAFGELPGDEVLRLAASLDLVSPHVLAEAIVRAARERRLPLTFPEGAREELGAGIRGTVGGRAVALGKPEWVTGGGALPAAARALRRRSLLDGSSCVFVAVDGELAGALLLEDRIRGDAPRTLRALKQAGFREVVLLTGDHVDIAEVVGAALGVDRVLAERAPEEKVEAVRHARATGVTVMVGDGINDAPALAAADVGVAMGARGASASSEAADVVLVSDRLDRLLEAVYVARRSRHIALQSILVGMGLSAVGMGFAAVGLLPPVAGALAQEGIDVAVILNALRALGGGRRVRRAADLASIEIGERFREEHRRLHPKMLAMRQTADRLDELPAAEARRQLEAIRHFLVDELLPHDQAEDATIYPLVAEIIGGEDPTGPMSRA
ncbi:MAG TPA: heavy metal translocating P-type ATPase, partial [Thermoanaerobaculia bacterium]|nr:heavy metal translocating P-type ATPase [Thermoanaerobaculia bacterium]